MGALAVEVLLEGVEPVVPDLALVVDPSTEKREVLHPETAGPPGALAPLLDQAAAAQDCDVMRDRLLGQGERLGELSDRRFAPGETSHQRAPDGVTQGGEGCVEVVLGGRGGGGPAPPQRTSSALCKCVLVYLPPRLPVVAEHAQEAFGRHPLEALIARV